MNVALRGAAASGEAAAPPGTKPASLARSSSSSSGTLSPSAHLSAFTKSSRSSTPTEDDFAVEVALKVIPKKKVKGNESSVWGEMDVLRGLDHPNIVRISLRGP